MSIIDSISERQNEVISAVTAAEISLRAQYETLSNLFWDHPTQAMTYALDDLLKVIEQVKLWHLELEDAARRMGDEI